MCASGRGKSKCKGPEVRGYLARSKNEKEASVAGAERMTMKAEGEDFRRISTLNMRVLAEK